MKPYLLKETNYKNIKGASYEVAILPWGATEAHNLHLPYGTDVIQARYFAEKSAAIATEKGAKVIVLPTIPFGVNTTQMDIPFTINMMPSTQMIVLKDIVASLVKSGIKKLVILNSHGGNDFKQMIREVYLLFPEIFICQMNWFKSFDFKDYFSDTGDHAGEMETCIMLKIAPELVLPLSEAGDGNAKKIKFEASQEGWVWSPRPWSTVTSDTGIGNPKDSTVEKGEKYLNDVIQKISDFLIELSKSDINNLYK